MHRPTARRTVAVILRCLFRFAMLITFEPSFYSISVLSLYFVNYSVFAKKRP